MKKIFTALSLFVVLQKTSAQIGIGTLTPDASAQLDISSKTKGLLIPRMTETERNNIPSKAIGLLVYQTSGTQGFYFWDGTTWKQLGGAGGWGLNGNNAGNSDFIGTINGVDLQFKVNNSPAGQISYSITSPLLLGYESGLGNSGSYVTAIGYQAGLGNTGSSVTAIGHQAASSNNSQSYLTAIGFNALQNSKGYGNTAVGGLALKDNTFGGYNTAIGGWALRYNNMGSNNTAIGESAISSNTSGSRNTAIGSNALFRTTAGDNTAIGSDALFWNTSGSNNTSIGSDAGPSSSNSGLNNTTAIGKGARVDASNQVRIGNTSVTSIGGYAAWSNLSDIRYKKNIQPQTHGLDFILALQPITYNTDVKKLNRLLYGNKADSINSDAINVKSIAAKEGVLYSGFSAQQVEEAAKKVGYNFSGVHKPENDKSHYTLEYATFVVPLVKAVQEQQSIIDNQNKRIEQLEKQLAEVLQKLK